MSGTSDITVTILAVQEGPGSITLLIGAHDPHANELPYLRLDRIEVYRSTNADLSGLVLAGRTEPGASGVDAIFYFTDDGLTPGVRYYYLARAVNVSDQSGELSNSLSGVPAATSDTTGWTDFSPVPRASSGVLGDYSAIGRYKKFGRVIHYQFEVEPSGIVSATRSLLVPLPLPAASHGLVLPYFACDVYSRDAGVAGPEDILFSYALLHSAYNATEEAIEIQKTGTYPSTTFPLGNSWIATGTCTYESRD